MKEMFTDVLNFFEKGGPLFTALAVILILIIGRWIAKWISRIIRKALVSAKIDEALKLDGFSLAHFIGKLVYFLLMIIVLMSALEVLGVRQVLDPLKTMTEKFFNYIPNIVIAGLIGYIGYFLAKVASEAVNLVGDTLLKLAPKFNFPEKINIVEVAKKVIFILIFIPILIIAINTLEIEAITKPSTVMLNKFSEAIPNIIAAIVILLAAVILGKLLTGLLRGLLESLKLNSIADKLEIDRVLGNTNLAKLVSNLVYFIVIYFAIIEAASQLGLGTLVVILTDLLYLFGKIAFGLLILAIGNFVANLVATYYNKGENANKFAGTILKGAVIVIFLTMGLYSMGIAESIVELAFSLGMGAIAIAFALAFGLGGREAAGEEMKNFFKRMKNNNDK